MNIKTYSLLTLITLCSISAHGMENNTNNNFDNSLIGLLQQFARQSVQNLYKNIEIAEKTAKKEKYKSTYNKNCQFMHSDKVNDLTAQEKSDLLISLQESNQLIKECYGQDTLSEETGRQCDNNTQLIKELERH